MREKINASRCINLLDTCLGPHRLLLLQQDKGASSTTSFFYAKSQILQKVD